MDWYVIVADSGGGGDGYPSLDAALARFEPGETGVEIWQISYDDYEQLYLTGEVDIAEIGNRVYSNW